MSCVEVSVIIPTRNRREKILATLSSLYEQDFDGLNGEIVVVDDGSSPAVEIPQDAMLHTRLVRLEGAGRSLARNTGAESAEWELLIFLDDDMQVCSDFLTAHYHAYQEWPDALLVGAIRLPLTDWSRPFVRFRQRLEDQVVPPRRGPVSARNFCTAANMAISRERFLDIGGFDPAIHSGEDQDFALRYTARQGLIVYIPEAAAIHCDSALDIRSYCERSEWGMREMIPFLQRYPDWPDNIRRGQINGFIQLGGEPLSLSARKCFKSIMAFRPVLEFLFGSASLLERLSPDNSILDRMYRLLLGVHIFLGYRKAINNQRGIFETGREVKLG